MLAPNGKIYAMPRDSTSVLIIDPQTNSADTTTITGLPGGADKWAGGALARNGLIYGIPYSETSALIIDTKSRGDLCENVALSAYFNYY